jgi:uncharacterized membrane protein YtjA (UPF0391 family)
MDSLSLIDWPALAASVLWIAGLALALAALSFAGFESSSAHQPFGALLKQRRFDLTLNLAGLLFCAGLAASTAQLLQLILWTILAVLFLVSAVLALRKPHR